MAAKKGQFPERPPTLAEALYGGKEIGTKPESFDENLLKNLPITNPPPQAEENTKKVIKREIKKETKKDIKKEANREDKKTGQPSVLKPTGQVNSFMSEPLPQDAANDISSSPILPQYCEAVTNLQMDYILQRKGILTKSLISSRTTSSVIMATMSILAYWKISGYFSEYTFQNGIWEGITALFGNSYFLNDFTQLIFLLVLIAGSGFSFVHFTTGFFAEESEQVPGNFEKYFNANLTRYAKLGDVNKNYGKLSKDDRDLVDLMKKNTICVIYRGVPVAFIVKKNESDESTFKIIGYGVRRVYVKAELFKDLIGFIVRDLVKNDSDGKILIDVYNFEQFDKDILKKVGFFRVKEQNCDSKLLSLVFGVRKETYCFETNPIEF